MGSTVVFAAACLASLFLTGCSSTGLPDTLTHDPMGLDGSAMVVTFPDGLKGSGSAETEFGPIAEPALPPNNYHLALGFDPALPWVAMGPMPDSVTVTLMWALEVTDGTGAYAYLAPAAQQTAHLVRDGSTMRPISRDLRLDADLGPPDVSSLVRLLTGSTDRHAFLVLVVKVTEGALPPGATLTFTVATSSGTWSY